LEKVEVAIFEFLELHVDWDRMLLPPGMEIPRSESPTGLPSLDSEPAEATTLNEVVAHEDGINAETSEPFSIATTSDEDKKTVLRNVVGMLVAAAVRTQECEAVEKDVDIKRAGIAMLRVP
jgi:hypothetical protein